jgi:large subunit ribosomal protein L3
MAAIIGRKVGMTQMFGEDGARVPLTLIEAGPCPVTQVKTAATDGYEAVQLGFGVVKPTRLTSPERGHLRKAGAPPVKHLHEFSPDELGRTVTVGDVVTVEGFEPGEAVRVTGTSRGKGYAGTVKRHHFKRGPESHGSHNIRQPGSIGAAAYPARVMKGLRMSGHLGARRVTQRGLQVVDRDPDRNLLILRGAVPGAAGGIVVVRPE